MATSQRRQRHVKSFEQLATLRAAFELNPHPSPAAVAQICEQSGLKHAEVSAWFRKERFMGRRRLASPPAVGAASHAAQPHARPQGLDLLLHEDDETSVLVDAELGMDPNALMDVEELSDLGDADAFASAAASHPPTPPPPQQQQHQQRAVSPTEWMPTSGFGRKRKQWVRVVTDLPAASPERRALLKALLAALTREERAYVRDVLDRPAARRPLSDPNIAPSTLRGRSKRAWEDVRRALSGADADMSPSGFPDPNLQVGLVHMFRPHRDYLAYVARELLEPHAFASTVPSGSKRARHPSPVPDADGLIQRPPERQHDTADGGANVDMDVDDEGATASRVRSYYDA